MDLGNPGRGECPGFDTGMESSNAPDLNRTGPNTEPNGPSFKPSFVPSLSGSERCWVVGGFPWGDPTLVYSTRWKGGGERLQGPDPMKGTRLDPSQDVPVIERQTSRRGRKNQERTMEERRHERESGVETEHETDTQAEKGRESTSGREEVPSANLVPTWDLLPNHLENRLEEDDWRYLAFQCFGVMADNDENQDEMEHVRVQLEVPEIELTRIRKYAKQIKGRRKVAIEASLFLQLVGQARFEDFRSKSEFLMWRRRLVEAIAAYMDLLAPKQILPRVKESLYKEFQVLLCISADSDEYSGEAIAFVEKIFLLLEAHGCCLKLPDAMRQKLYASLLSAAFPTWEDGVFCKDHGTIVSVVQGSRGMFNIAELEASLSMVAALVIRFSHNREVEFLIEAANVLEQIRPTLSGQELLEQSGGIFESLSDWAFEMLLASCEGETLHGVEFDLLAVFLSEPKATQLACKVMHRQYRSAYELEKQSLKVQWVEQNRTNPFYMLNEQIEEACKPNIKFFAALASAIRRLWESNHAWIACLPSKEAWMQGCLVLVDMFTADVKAWIATGPENADILVGLKELCGLQTSVKNRVGDPAAVGKELWDLQPYSTIAYSRWISVQTGQLLTWVERLLAQESWISQTLCGYATSLTDFLRSVEEMVDAFFELGVPYTEPMVRLLVEGIDHAAQLFAEAAASPYSSADPLIPPVQPQTRYKASVHDQYLANILERREKTEILLGKDVVLHNILPRDILCRANSVEGLRSGLSDVETQLERHLGKANQLSTGQEHTDRYFEGALMCCTRSMSKILSFIAHQVVFKGLNFHIMQELYRGTASSARAERCFLSHIDKLLGDICVNLHSKKTQKLAAYQLLTTTVKAWEVVVLDGGPERMFGIGDCLLLESDLQMLSNLFHADGEGLPVEEIQNVTARAHGIVSMMSLSTLLLIENFEEVSKNARRTSVSPTSNPDIYLKVLCHRKDHAASKFLKERFNVPKAKAKNMFFKATMPIRTPSRSQGP